MVTKKQLDAMTLYADVMAEIKVRMTSIVTAAHSKTGLPSPLVREFCFLQLRMVCELIALGCLAAHGDIKAAQSGKLMKEYSAERIFAQLENLHPDFYPHPVRSTLEGPGRHHLQPITEGFLTKADLLRLYTKCGSIFHRGNVKKLLSDRMPTQFNFPEITGWTEKILVLLRVHRVALLGNMAAFICTLHNSERGGRVEVAIAEAIEEQ